MKKEKLIYEQLIDFSKKISKDSPLFSYRLYLFAEQFWAIEKDWINGYRNQDIEEFMLLTLIDALNGIEPPENY